MEHEVPGGEGTRQYSLVRRMAHGDDTSNGGNFEPPGSSGRFSVTQATRIVCSAHR